MIAFLTVFSLQQGWKGVDPFLAGLVSRARVGAIAHDRSALGLQRPDADPANGLTATGRGITTGVGGNLPRAAGNRVS